MTDRYEALSARTYKDRDGNEKTSFTRIGVAFAMRDRDGFNIQLEAIPAPQDGTYRILLMPPKPREEQSEPRRQERREAPKPQLQSMYTEDDMDDSIPF